MRIFVLFLIAMLAGCMESGDTVVNVPPESNCTNFSDLPGELGVDSERELYCRGRDANFNCIDWRCDIRAWRAYDSYGHMHWETRETWQWNGCQWVLVYPSKPQM